DVEMTEVAGTPSGATENLAVNDQAAPDAAHPTEVGRYGIRSKAQLNPDGMQGCQLAVVGHANMSALDSQVSQGRSHFRGEREVLPLWALRQAHSCPVFSDVSRHTDFHRDQLLVNRQPTKLSPQLTVECGEAGVRVRPAEVCHHAVAPQLPPSQGCGCELESVEVDAYAEDAPRLTVKVNWTSRSASSLPANRIELFDDP